MSLIIQPKRWTAKPPLGVQIQLGHALTRGLVGCWLFNEGGGQTVYDLALYGKGNFQNTPTWGIGSSGPAVAMASASSQYISVAHNSGVTLTNDFSVEFSFYMNSLRNYNAGVTKTNAGSPDPFDIYIGVDGILHFYGGNSSLVLSPALSAGVWYHIIGVLKAADSTTGLKLYINGVLQGTDTASVATDSGQTIRFGSRNDGLSNLDGRMQWVRLWNRALSADEVYHIYTDPYCVLQPQSPQPRYWVAPSSAFTWQQLTQPDYVQESHRLSRLVKPQLYQHFVSSPDTTFTEITTPDRYQPNTQQPLQQPKQWRYEFQNFAGPISNVFPEITTPDRYQPNTEQPIANWLKGHLSDPRIEYPTFGGPVSNIFPEVTTVDRWFVNAERPLEQPKPRHSTFQNFAANVLPIPTVAAPLILMPESELRLPPPRAWQHLFPTFANPITTTFAEVTLLVKYGPYREEPWPWWRKAARDWPQRYFQFFAGPVSNIFAEVTTPDRYGPYRQEPIAQWRKQLLDDARREYQFFAGPVSPVFSEITTPDRWQPATNMPLQRIRQWQYLYIHSLAWGIFTTSPSSALRLLALMGVGQ